MVTSVTHRRWDGDIEIEDRAEAKLPLASIVRSAQIATIEAPDVTAVGRLSINDQAKLKSVIRHTLAPMRAP